MSPQLSYCSLVNTPPERVAATLQPLRELDPQIVLAVDDRVEPSWIDGYRELADRVFLVRYPGSFARTYAWLREQCDGRWIVQLDADEVPAPGLAAEIAATIAAGDVTHAWIRCRWLYPDARSYLAQWPWRPDYSLRLLRNDPTILRFPAQMHSTVAAVGPKRYLREPLYHADLLSDVTAREGKLARYDEGRPGFVIDGLSLNEVYYLPERRSDLRTLTVPEHDAEAITTFLDGAALPPRSATRAPASVRRVELTEIVASSEHRELGEADYCAQLTLLDDDLRLVAGEWRTFDVEVRNLGTTHWPGGLEARPQVRLAYRPVGKGGALGDGMRTGLGAPLAAGASAIVPLEVLGPPSPGPYEIEIDLVHEHVRWFDRGVRAAIDVRAAAGGAAGALIAP